jgi:hypothetical protein
MNRIVALTFAALGGIHCAGGQPAPQPPSPKVDLDNFVPGAAPGGTGSGESAVSSLPGTPGHLRLVWP